MNSIIESIYNESFEIINKLIENNEISLSIDAKRHFTKIFILSTASYFEDKIQNILIRYIGKSTNNNEYVINFVRNKAISFQYHTYFDWGKKGIPEKPGKNANTFLSLFGDNFKIKIDNIIKSNPNLENSIKCFLEIGHMRNILIHSNFAAYNNIPKTIEEFKEIFTEAEKFIFFLEDILINSEEN